MYGKKTQKKPKSITREWRETDAWALLSQDAVIETKVISIHLRPATADSQNGVLSISVVQMQECNRVRCFVCVEGLT